MSSFSPATRGKFRSAHDDEEGTDRVHEFLFYIFIEIRAEEEKKIITNDWHS